MTIKKPLEISQPEVSKFIREVRRLTELTQERESLTRGKVIK
jgi:hypothetical protein